MLLKICCLIFILIEAEARYNFIPKFYGQDSAVIIDTDKVFPVTQNQAAINYSANKLRLPPPFMPLWRHFPRYHIIAAPPAPAGQIMATNTWPKVYGATKPITTSTTTTSTSTTTTTPAPTTTSTTPTLLPIKIDSSSSPFVTDDEFPKELLLIAQKKLGLKSLDEIPSITELGQLLGTNTPEETINYIKQLTSNEQGIALMKAYIESADYTDTAGDANSDKFDVSEENLNDINEPMKINDEGLVVITDEDSNDDYKTDQDDNADDDDVLITTTTPEPALHFRKNSKLLNKFKDIETAKPGLMERIIKFMHLNKFLHKTEELKPMEGEEKPLDTVRKTAIKNIEIVRGTKITKQSIKQVEENESNMEMKNTETQEDKITAISLRDPIPYTYPIPIRAQKFASDKSDSSTTSSTVVKHDPHSDDTEVVHLNTPKILIPHVHQLSRVTSIPTKKIEDFLQSKPKLLALANKVSRFPIGYDRNSPMEVQVLAAVQRAIEQDDDLKKLLSSTATLK